MRSARPWRRAVVALVVAGCGTRAGDPAANFVARVTSYTAVVRRAAAGLPAGNPADARSDDARRAALAAKVRAALPDWGPGKIFTPPIATELRARIARALDGPEGRDARDAILDENPTGLRPAALSTYPEAAPLATMPPAILAVLPSLPEELEYRFVGRDLILHDVGANLVVDVLEHAFR
jgi:hypothetical protein